MGWAGARAVALSGILSGMIVFLTEAITTVRAVWSGETRRVSNLAYGAARLLRQARDPGGESGEPPAPPESAYCSASLGARRVTALHGAAHPFVFVLDGLSVFG